MKKNLIFAMGLISITTFAQVGRVGINTDQPRATLDIVGKPFTGEATDKSIPRGVILPHISDAQKAEFTDKTEGLMIWNTTKKCIDYWNGTEWQCYGGTNTTPNPSTSYTGYATWGDTAGESITVSKVCPTGQTSTTINYPVNSSQYITYSATSTISQADANQKALDLMNSTAKQQERQTIAQDYANANGTCSSAPNGATTTVGTEFKCDAWGNYSQWKIETNLGYFTCKTDIFTETYDDAGYWFWDDRGNANAKDYGLTEICYSEIDAGPENCTKIRPNDYGSFDESHILVIGKVGTDGSVITWVKRVN